MCVIRLLPRFLVPLIAAVAGTLPAAEEKFAQLGALLPPATEARLASGAPGPAYWQQEVNYTIEAELDEARSVVRGSARIEYVNHSPHELSYLWLQLDQNALANNSNKRTGDQPLRSAEARPGEPAEIGYPQFRAFVYEQEFDGGYRLDRLVDASGQALPHQIVDTNLRIDLPAPLASGDRFTFQIAWEFPIMDEALSFRHGRIELEGGGHAYQIAQWYPRLCAYDDQSGWQLKHYLGYGEFALEFGRFDVRLTVPEDFVVAATGELQNADEVLSAVERQRLARARGSREPVKVVTAQEADARLGSPASGKKTWVFHAERVRDFAFAGSRGYLWDAMGVEIDGETVMAMSAYPKQMEPLWGRYSTEAVAQTLRVYSERILAYPYPVAWSTWGGVNGMEYPMISFQSGSKIDEHGTYPESMRNYVISVVVHEVGHNWFPMIINSDERQWMWMDEGLNSFVEWSATASFDPRFADHHREAIDRVMENMRRSDDPIIMVSADNQTQRGLQAYRKPALALTVLRDGILGREAFDFAFREYARRWAFKRPTPADFFRTMEDASGTDLDWFWRAWFFGNSHVDVAIESVEELRLDDGSPAASKAADRAELGRVPDPPFLVTARGGGFSTGSSARLQDWYHGYDRYAATREEIASYEKSVTALKEWQQELLRFGRRVYLVKARNVGGVPVPLTLDIVFDDGSERRLKVPAEVWRFEHDWVSIPFIADRAVDRIELDRENALADVDWENNQFPRRIRQGRIKLTPEEKDENPMRAALFPEEGNESPKAEAPAAP